MVKGNGRSHKEGLYRRDKFGKRETKMLRAHVPSSLILFSPGKQFFLLLDVCVMRRKQTMAFSQDFQMEFLIMYLFRYMPPCCKKRYCGNLQT